MLSALVYTRSLKYPKYHETTYFDLPIMGAGQSQTPSAPLIISSRLISRQTFDHLNSNFLCFPRLIEDLANPSFQQLFRQLTVYLL